MKKLLIGMVAVAAVLAIAAPAFAAYTMHVRALTDIGWNMRSEEITNSGESNTNIFMNLPGHDYLKGLWISDDKTTGAHVEFSISQRNFGNNSSVNLRYLYGWYKVGNCRLLIGQSDSWFGSPSYFAKQVVGLNASKKLLLLGNGVMYASRTPHIRFEWKNNGYGFMIGAVTPLAIIDGTPTLTFADGTSSTADFSGVLPRFDMAFLFRAGGFQTTPGFSWSMQQYQWAEAIEDAYDLYDTVHTWCLVLPAKFTMGGFTVKGQFHIGQNYDYEYFHGLGSANAGIAGQPLSIAYPSADGTSVEDTKMLGGSLSFEYMMGAVGLFLGGGIQNYQNDIWEDYGYEEDSYTRYGVYAGMQYNINKHFYIHPEISYWNYGDSVYTGDDAGYEWLFGAQFGFIF
jgi:hypothetical protein